MPDDAEECDVVCIVFDGTKPLLLRPVPGDDDEFSPVGACYVPRIIEGEAIKMLETGYGVEQRFQLRRIRNNNLMFRISIARLPGSSLNKF